MKELVEKLKASLSLNLANYQNPVLFWSSGRDSQLLLHLLPEIPIIQLRSDWRKSQKQFADSQILEKNLHVISFAPSDRFLLQKNGVVLVDDYNLNGDKLPIIRDVVHSDHNCILQISKQKTDDFPFIYDFAIVGWKKSDKHIVLGDFELSKEIKIGGATFFAPLFDLTDEQISELCSYLNIPLSPFYVTKEEKLDTGNILACSRCVETTEEVFCPQLQKNIQGKYWDKETSLENFQRRFRS